jgi:hypothetical protein
VCVFGSSNFFGIVRQVLIKIQLRGFYDPVLGACFDSTLRKYLINAVRILVIKVMLLTGMLIELLRCPHSSSTGL